ncbi:hypothetical protein KJ966_05825 [bacterium]|nr:hypothetical protein [bacterium]
MNVQVFLKLGNEITKSTQTLITGVFESSNLQINTGKPTKQDRVGFIIKQNVADKEKFVECVYKALQCIPKLFLVAPQICLNQVKHHPGVYCFDSGILSNPETGIKNLISYAYHGGPQ